MNLNDYIKFDDSRKQFEIITGTQGKYSYDDVTRVSVLNEKAKWKRCSIYSCASRWTITIWLITGSIFVCWSEDCFKGRNCISYLCVERKDNGQYRSVHTRS